ncbi:hypothetical protein [Legionella bozemanae]|uniref:Uncharacterized protein n=1 Tax=Legionella bozemanae TaxID=447 RepID=A0A0W0RY97_LEGBO|nr:hypothetical protein [Legionella bozemanae]KTC75877.1 hypothetical protein Lboz_0705 [Legionella bozemanae]STO35500.1 Uncharacterised protein [Legionella bozemanae]
MKIKLLIASISALLTFNVMAETSNPSKEEMDKKAREYLAKSGINIPETTDISIVSATKYINAPTAANDKNDAYIAKKMQEFLSMNQEQQKNGYVQVAEPRAKELMELKYIAPTQIKKYKDTFSPISTHIRMSIDEIKLAYTFLGVPETDRNLTIGVAPFGAYKQVKNGDKGDGWDGAVQFFEKDGIGSCAYYEHNRILAQSGVELIKELVTYDVDNKPTIVLVKGTEQTGFVYKLKWYDQTFSRELECANTKFSSQIRSEVINLANRIENYQHQ